MFNDKGGPTAGMSDEDAFKMMFGQEMAKEMMGGGGGPHSGKGKNGK